MVVGGGYGAAALVGLAARLRDRGSRVAAVTGAASADRLCSVEELAAVAEPVVVTTDDGSAGRRGRVTDALDELIADAGVVYACGPMAMLRAVADVATAAGIPSYVAVEESMACGIGVCMTCVLPVIGDDGRTRFSRSCAEGPIFGGDRVRFADVGTLPGTSSGPTRWGWCTVTVVETTRTSTCRPRWVASRSRARCSRRRAAAAFGAELEPFVDSPRSGRWSPSRCSCGRGRAGRRRGWPRRRAGCSTRSACRAPASTGCSPTTCPGWPSAGRARWCRSPAPASRTSPSWPSRLRGVPGVLGLEVNISCPNVESRGEVFACDPVAASDVVGAVRAAADPAQPVYAKLSRPTSPTSSASPARARTPAPTACR